MPHVQTPRYRKYLCGKIKNVLGLRGASQQNSQCPPTEINHIRGFRSPENHGRSDVLSALYGQAAEVYMNSQLEKAASDTTRSASTSEGTLSEIGSDTESDPDSQVTEDSFGIVADARFSVPSRPLPEPGMPPRALDWQATISSRNVDDAASTKASRLLSSWKRASSSVREENADAQEKMEQNKLIAAREEAEAIMEALHFADQALDLHFSMLHFPEAENLDDESDERVALREAEAALELHFQWLDDEAERLNGYGEANVEESEDDTDVARLTQWEIEASLDADEFS